MIYKFSLFFNGQTLGKLTKQKAYYCCFWIHYNRFIQVFLFRKSILSFFIFYLAAYANALAQNGKLKGKITDTDTHEPIPFANIILQGTTLGATSDLEGNYIISDITPGLYNIEVSVIGYQKQTASELTIQSTKTIVQDFELKSSTLNLSEVEVSGGRFEKNEVSPLSKISIRSAEILRNPGGNRDISKVLQSFPGVASTVSFRNDIIIRGGAPNENRFYLDGIETPNINHFATQGSSGGPVGMINVNFIDQVEFYSGAFPANRGNALSSVLEFKQRNGNPDRLVTNLMLGSSDIGITLDGPVSKKSDFIFSLRRSYLQLLFSALKLPFLPLYNDAQLKVNYDLNKNNSITLIGLGAIDKFRLNEKVNNGVTDSAIIERNNYILGYLPVNEQWNYTTGIKYTHFSKNGFQHIVLSRNMLSNTTQKYQNNNSSNPSDIILDYKSSEEENKIRVENTLRKSGWRINYGINYEYAVYLNRTFNQLFIPSGITFVNYSSRLVMNKAGVFVHLSKAILNNRLLLSGGLRSDVNDYSVEMQNPLHQLSPRISVSYRLFEKWFLNFNAGKYFQLPPYTALGFRDSSGTLVNKENKITYISSNHFVSGLEFLPDKNTKISVETFFKFYFNYPLLIDERISLANLGSDFGVIGNKAVISTSKGRSHGVEFFIQRTIKKGFYGIGTYTFVKSEFTNAGNVYNPSSWDNRHIISLTGGKQFKKNWELGIKFRFLSGAPYTPYDPDASAQKSVWDITRQGVQDYSKVNSKRISSTHQLDLRIDKKYYFKKSLLNIYVDIQNIYNNKTDLPSYLTVVTDSNNNPIEDPQDSSKYLLKEIPNESGTILPSVGIMYEF